MPRISVIVPVYRVEGYLKRCVDSILAQSFRDFDLILVDDGSPDRCGEICEDYVGVDTRVKVIHQENGGLSAARNAGIDWAMANSDSQWLAFVDSDDWVHEAFLERLYQAAEKLGCRISACGFYRTEGEPIPEELKQAAFRVSADAYYCSETIHGGQMAVAWNKLYHKSLFSVLRYPVGKLHEDEFTTYQAIYEAGQVAVVEQMLYAYYQNPNGIIRSAWNPRRMHLLEAVEQQMEFAKKQNRERLYRKAVELYIFAIHEQIQKAEDTYPQYRKVLRKKCRKALKLGRECGVFPLGWDTLWAYEEGYPCKGLWWLVSRIGASRKRKITDE